MEQPQVAISIDGKVLNTFSSLTLNQSMYDHHTFDLVVGHDIIEDLGGHILDGSKAWIGKDIAVLFGDNEFHGIVTSIAMDHNTGLNGDLVISGASHTILLEAGDHMQSWNDKPLKQIVEAVAAEASVEAVVAPAHTAPIEYMAQYGESHFGFLQRLAATFHEWLYYDGKALVFGRPADLGAPVPVVYGTDLDNVQIAMRALPLQRKAYSYLSGKDETIQSEADGQVPGLDGLGSEALSASMDRFALKPQSVLPTRVSDKDGLDKVLKKQQAAAAARLTSLSASGTVMALRPGVVADISAAIRPTNAWEMKPYGKYLVLNIQHHFTGNHQYQNRFEAIPAELEVLPPPRVRLPQAEPQIATVLSNADPENQGRVQVRFLWQDASMKSPWMRVTSPDAGKSDQVSSNRGMVTIPEEGDQVMVGFRYNDPMRPFVLGSLFHGKSGGGGGQGNKTKSLTTRSGCTVSHDDKGSVTISDPSGNTIVMKGDGTMEITAPNELTIQSKKINILASEEIEIQGTNKVNIGSQEITGIGSTKVTLSSDTAMDISAPSTTVKGETSMKVEGTNVDITGSAITNVKGNTMLNLN